MANEDAVSTYFQDMLSHFSDCWCILEPLLTNAVNAIDTECNLNFGIDKRIDYDATVLVDNANLAYSTLVVMSVHLTVHRHEERHLCLLRITWLILFVVSTEKLQYRL